MKPKPPAPSPPLPIEVWGQIFEKIDSPLDLMRARRVCKRWNEEINRVLPFANWKKLCFREIGVFSLSSIAAVVQPTLPKANYREIEDQNFWRDVYYHYKKWLKITKLPIQTASPSNKLLLSNHEHITCFDTWGVWTMYGSNIGRIYILEDDGHRKRRRAIDLHGPIDEVKIWHSDNDQFLFFAVTQLKTIHIGYPQINITLRGHKVCTGTANNLYYMQDNILIKLKPTPPTVGVTLTITLNFNLDEQIVAISSRESKIFLVVQAEAQLRIFTIEDESLRKEEPMFQVLSIVEVPSLPVVSPNMRIYVTLNSTIICLINENMYLHTPETDFWVIHDQSKYFEAKVTSLIVHGNYLILGLSNGTLSMYYVEGTDNLLNPNLFGKQPVITRKLNSLPIIAIKVADVHGNIHITVFSPMNMFTLIF
ncbi:uncharacterized protein [Chelonus insularis]|uniref:uncharacterized protein n=1 Tax=Chelonus insularis TaxID=460826 RepID=UPI00158D3E07|nr:uncharacterized protein LOC118072390 [Chelonus insularis]